jgi:hypothetical protein
MKKEAARLLTYDRWSPELISATGKETGKCPNSHEYLYQWIWCCKYEKNRENKTFKGLYQFLRMVAESGKGATETILGVSYQRGFPWRSVPTSEQEVSIG